MKLDDCLQEKCAHCPLNPMAGKTGLVDLCPVCRKCGAPKHVINTDCSECIKCENGEGYLRGNLDGSGEIEVAVEVRQK